MTEASALIPPEVAALRAKIAAVSHNSIVDWAAHAAAAFGRREAANIIAPAINGVIAAVHLLDDVQDEEAGGLHMRIGAGRVFNLSQLAALDAMEVVNKAGFDDERWAAAIAALGRGLRETARGQVMELEAAAAGRTDDFWAVVDAKTPPLVATALELGALVAGATPAAASDLVQLAVPAGRLIQIHDDITDAIGQKSGSDWRRPHANLLMAYSLSGPRGPEFAALAAAATNVESINAARHFLLADGALSYAMHALRATIDDAAGVIAGLDVPHRDALEGTVTGHRRMLAHLMTASGVPESDVASVLPIGSPARR